MADAAPTMDKKQIPVVVLIALQLLYLAALFNYGRFMGGDEIAYKAAGRDWAASGHFVGTELRGYGHWVDPARPHELPNAFVPPVYTGAFGLFVKLFGFTPRTNALFDALIHVALGWATWALARALGASPWLATAAAIVTIPLGTAGRPDELGMVLGLFAAVCAVKQTRPWLAGTLLGVGGAASLAAAALLALHQLVPPRSAGILPAVPPPSRRRRQDAGGTAGWKPALHYLVRVVLAGAVMFAAAMTPLLLTVPDVPARIANMAGHAASLSYRYAFAVALRYSLQNYLLVLAAVAPLVAHAAHAAHAAATRARGEWRRFALAWAPPLAALAALVILLPVKGYYVWIVGPGLLAASAAALTTVSWKTRIAAAVPAVAFSIAAAARPILMFLVVATLPPGQRLDENVDLIRRTIPPNRSVMTWDFWPALAGTYETYSTEANPGWERVDYLVLTGNGSGRPGLPQSLLPAQQAEVATHFVPVLDHLNREAFSLGPLHTNSAWGYGPLILKRIGAP